MSTATPATRFLDKAAVIYEVHLYDYGVGEGPTGLLAARAIGWQPEFVLKTLMAELDGLPVCAVIPSDQTLSMKKLARVLGGKSAKMMPPEKAERLTGYHTGGISPFGQKKRVPVAVDAAAINAAQHAGHGIVVNGGKRGMMLELSPQAVVDVLLARAASLCAE